MHANVWESTFHLGTLDACKCKEEHLALANPDNVEDVYDCVIYVVKYD